MNSAADLVVLAQMIPFDQSEPLDLEHTRCARFVREILDREEWLSRGSTGEMTQEELSIAPNLKLLHQHNLRQDSHFVTVLIRLAGGAWFEATDVAGPWHSFLADELRAAAHGAKLQPELAVNTLEQFRRDWTPC